MTGQRVSDEEIKRVLTTDGLQPEAKWALALRDARAENARLRSGITDALRSFRGDRAGARTKATDIEDGLARLLGGNDA